MDLRDLRELPKFCNMCKKPWHGFGTCPVYFDDEQDPPVPVEAVNPRSHPSLLLPARSKPRCGICADPGHKRTRCPKDPARKRASACSGSRVEKCGRCAGHGHRAERCAERYLEFWQRALTQANHEDDLAAEAAQAPTTEAAHEPKDGEELADAAQDPTEQSDHGDEGKDSYATGEETGK